MMTEHHAEPIDPELLAAIQLSLSGQVDVARRELLRIWQRLALTDHFHRCVLAHYLADLQETASNELAWDHLALEAALDAVPHTFENRIPDVTWESFLPSLYLNVAASHERMSENDAARTYAVQAHLRSCALGNTPLAELTRGAIHRLRVRLGIALELTTPPTGSP